MLPQMALASGWMGSRQGVPPHVRIGLAFKHCQNGYARLFSFFTCDMVVASNGSPECKAFKTTQK